MGTWELDHMREKSAGKGTHGLEGYELSSQMQTFLLLYVSHVTPCNKVRLKIFKSTRTEVKTKEN